MTPVLSEPSTRVAAPARVGPSFARAIAPSSEPDEAAIAFARQDTSAGAGAGRLLATHSTVALINDPRDRVGDRRSDDRGGALSPKRSSVHVGTRIKAIAGDHLPMSAAPAVRDASGRSARTSGAYHLKSSLTDCWPGASKTRTQSGALVGGLERSRGRCGQRASPPSQTPSPLQIEADGGGAAGPNRAERR